MVHHHILHVSARILTWILGCLLVLAMLPGVSAQTVSLPNRWQVLRAAPGNAFTRIAPPAAYTSRTKVRGATFHVTYDGFTPEAQQAFQKAVDIWSTVIESPVTIEVYAKWSPLGTGILGQCGPGNYTANFAHAPQLNTWYPVALANKLAGTDLLPASGGDPTNPDDPNYPNDMFAEFSSSFTDWYFGLDGQAPAGKYDFVTVVLHEMGHGLGFLGSMNVSGVTGSWGYGTTAPFIYDRYAVNNLNQSLLNTTLFPNNSTQLKAQLTGNNLFFNGPNAVAAAEGVKPKLYAPSTWQPGSSYSHLDEAAYPVGDANSLMTPALAGAEVIHDPGAITRGIFKDMGWTLAVAPVGGKPDLALRVTGESTFTGNNIYNADGTSQTKSQAANPGATAYYFFSVQNDHTNTDTITVTGPAGVTGWTVAYYNAANTNITAQVTGTGWSTGALAAGAVQYFSMRITPAVSALPGVTCNILLTAKSGIDATKLDAVKAVTTVATNRQPDLWVRTQSDATYIGDNIYNTSSAGQTKTGSVRSGIAAVYVFRVQNDGNVAGTVKVTGTASGSGWTVSYYDGTSGANLTTAVTGTGWTTATLAIGGSQLLLAYVTPSITPAPGTAFTVQVIARSSVDTLKADVAKVVTSALITRQPDLWIRNSYDTVYAGDNVLNTTGFGQTKEQLVAAGSWVHYLFRVQNDGNTTDSFRVTGTGASAGWGVMYYDTATNANITSAVTGTGYLLASVGKGSNQGIYLRVYPTISTAPGVFSIQLTAKSTADGTKLDVVKALTTYLIRRQPDTMIRLSAETNFSGDNIYNFDGTGQTHSTLVNAGISAIFHVQIQNDGGTSESFRLLGTAGDANWQVGYTDVTTSTVITSAVTGAGWSLPALAPAAVRTVAITVTPTSGAVAGAVKTVLLQAASSIDSAKLDVVKAVTVRQ